MNTEYRGGRFLYNGIQIRLEYNQRGVAASLSGNRLSASSTNISLPLYSTPADLVVLHPIVLYCCQLSYTPIVLYCWTWLSYTPLYCIVVLLVVLHSHCIVLLDRHWFDDHSITAPPTALPSAQWSSPHSTLVLLERKVLLHITRLFKRKVQSSQVCLEL